MHYLLGAPELYLALETYALNFGFATPTVALPSGALYNPAFSGLASCNRSTLLRLLVCGDFLLDSLVIPVASLAIYWSYSPS